MRSRAAIVLLAAMVFGCSPTHRAPTASSTSTARSVTTAAPVTTTSIAAAGACPHGDYAPPWATRPRYRADITVDPGARTLTGTQDVHFTPDAPTDRLVFRLWANGALPGRAGGRIDIDHAVVTGLGGSGASITPEYTAAGSVNGTPGTVMTLPLGRTIGPDNAVDVQLSLRMRVPGPTPDRISTNGSNLRLGSVLPVLSWVRGEGWQTSPAVDALAEAAATEVADWDVTVHLPDGFSVLATGDEPEPAHFLATAVRDFALTLGRLRIATATAQAGRVQVEAGVGEGAGDDPADIAKRSAAALDAMAAKYGPYPYSRLTVSVTPGLRGGIEFPMHIQIGAGIAARHLVHEVGHQWFYGLVGNDQYRDPWLDESLTNYAEARVDNRLAADRRLPIPAGGAGRVGLSMAYWVAHRDIYFRSVYVQGTQALGAVADAVGGYDHLDCALARYVHERAYSVARPADLITAIREETGVDPRTILAKYGAS